eukprot:s4954_g5.t1
MVFPLQDDFTIENVERSGILRPFDPKEVAHELISEGKDGWKPDPAEGHTQNLANFFVRYTIHRGGEAYTMKVVPVQPQTGFIGQTFEATLATCLFDKTYVGRGAHTFARQAAAQQFLQDPDALAVFKLLPPTQADIRAKSILHTHEKRRCQAQGVSSEVMNAIVRKRMDSVMEVFHEMGYRLDVWDGNC